jgi:H+/Cl- antiporter ClcA
MIAPDVFHRLRAAQLRAAHEQELLSGRDWLLISASVHVLALVYPVFLWINVWLLHSASLGQHLHPAINVGLVILSGLATLGFWWWARYAPFRASLGALTVFLLIQAVLAALDPHQLVVSAISKTIVILGLLQAVAISHRRRRPQ